jgi:hypothetical protein
MPLNLSQSDIQIINNVSNSLEADAHGQIKKSGKLGGLQTLFQVEMIIH